MWTQLLLTEPTPGHQKAIRFWSSSYRKLILLQTVLCLTSRKAEKCFEHGQKCYEVEKKHGPNAEMMYSQQCHLVLCPLPQHHHSAFVQQTEGSWQSKRQIVKALFLPFFGETDGWMDRKNETTAHYYTSGTNGNLQAAWRREHARPRVAMGTKVHGVLNGHRRLCLCPGLNAHGSICQRGQKGSLKGKEAFLPASFSAFVKLNTILLSPWSPCTQLKEIKGPNV